MAIDNIADKIRAARELREHLLSDRYRPGYHFAIAEDIGRPGDPNGAFFAGGRYHLMYLYDRRGVDGWKGKGYAWGHISSADLVHWRHHPDALVPDDYDGGIFSGGAFLDDDGTAYLTYWRVNEVSAGTGIGIARSSDRHYERWEKLRVPSLDGTEFGIRKATGAAGGNDHLCNADPSNIWKHDGTYYLQLRVFVDKSVIEVFANDRQAITRRVYPERDANDRVALFARGGSAACSAIRTWDMMPSNAW